MMSSSPEERLRRLIESAEATTPDLIDRIQCRREPSDFAACYSHLARNHRVSAMRAMFVEHDERRFREQMYITCKLEIESIRLADYEQFGTGRELLDALLSDSAEVIRQMALFEPTYYALHRHDPLNPQFVVHMWQLAIVGDYDALEAKVQKLVKNGRKPMRELCSEKRDFFSLLMGADKPGLEARINEDAKLRNEDPITGGFFTYLATFEAKLCWYKGIEVCIDHPRVPMDLMPVKPLEHYDETYDFLKAGWVPPTQGVLARFSRWLER